MKTTANVEGGVTVLNPNCTAIVRARVECRFTHYHYMCHSNGKKNPIKCVIRFCGVAAIVCVRRCTDDDGVIYFNLCGTELIIRSTMRSAFRLNSIVNLIFHVSNGGG